MHTLTAPRIALIYAVPLTIIAFCAALVFSGLLQNNAPLAIGITYDLILTAPLAYFFMIRKTKIPNLTVVPMFALGIVVGSLLLPEHHQEHLSLAKNILLPVVEIAVFSFIIYRSATTIKQLRKSSADDQDILPILRENARQLVDHKRISTILATELAMLYYGFITWKKPVRPRNGFTSYRESGVVALFGAILFILLVETGVLHILLIRWSPIVAWVVMGLSVYTLMQLFAHVKAMRLRHIRIANGKLTIPYGIFSHNVFSLSEVKHVRISESDDDHQLASAQQIALIGKLEPHNIVIEFHQPVDIQKPYGATVKAEYLLLYVDQKEEFVKKLAQFLH